MPSRPGRYRGTELQPVEAQHRTAVGPARHVAPLDVRGHRRWLLEKFPELEAMLAHLGRCDNQIAPVDGRDRHRGPGTRPKRRVQ